MPYTLAHPAAVVPLHWLASGRLLLSPLVIGSLVPDTGYMIRSIWVSRDCHTPWGLVYLGLPIGVAALVAVHVVLRRPAEWLLPRRHQAAIRNRVPAFRFGSLSRCGWILVSIYVGALTHLAWDSVTQQNGAVVRLSPILSTELFEWSGRSVQVFSLLKYVSSLAGVLLLIYWYWQWLDQQPRTRLAVHSPSDRLRPWFVALLIAIAMLVGGAVAWQSTLELRGPWRAELAVVRLLLWSMSSLILGLAAFSVVYWIAYWSWPSFRRSEERDVRKETGSTVTGSQDQPT